MGLFSKKQAEGCPICGNEVKGLFKTKIDGGVAICRECADKLAIPHAERKKCKLDYIKQHLEYREKQFELYAAMEPTYTFSYGSTTVKADENKRLLSIFHAEITDSMDYPLVLPYDAVTGYQFYRIKKLVDDDTTPGKGASETFAAIFGANDANDTYTIKLKTTDPYLPELEIMEVAVLPYRNKGFTNNISGIGRFFKCIARNEPFSADMVL